MKVSTVRDGQGRILGNTRGPNDRLVSNNTADARLLFRK
jgi:hypothetical protein